MSKHFPLIEISGSPENRGIEYGRAAADHIAVGVDIYRESFDSKNISWERACELARPFAKQIKDYDEDFWREMEGIAKGSGQPVEHIVILNARTELLFWNNKVPGETAPIPDDCTAALALPEVTENGHMLHGQNWDWNPRCVDSSVVLKIKSENGPDILTFVEAGQLARSGMNSAGIGLTANGLHSDKDYQTVGIPNPFIRRRLLMQDRLGAALSAVTLANISFSHFLLISHAEGEAVGFEVTPERLFWMQPEDGIFTHANHFKIPAATAQLKDVSVLRTPDSIYRDSRTEKHIRGEQGSICKQTFMNAFTDTYGKPDSVLRFPAKRPGGGISATVASVIMDTTALKMWVAAAPYDGANYVEYSL